MCPILLWKMLKTYEILTNPKTRMILGQKIINLIYKVKLDSEKKYLYIIYYYFV